MKTVEIGSKPLDLAALLAILDEGPQIALAPVARARVQNARAVVDRYMTRDEPIYGLNTGLGGNVGYRIPQDEIEAFQVKMVRGRCIGVGAPFGERAGRAMLLSRITGMAQGGSGVSPAVLDLMVAMFNAGISPVIPGRGSIGAGDLGLCAHLGAALIGLGDVYVQGVKTPAAEALRAAGLAPARLGPKDGLAILNASAVSCGYASLVLAELAEILMSSVAIAALSGEGYAANPRIFDARLAEARPAGGQVQAAAAFRAALKDSYLYDPGAARSIQDALCFRVLSQIYGPAQTSFAATVASVETELNAAADNPLVMAEDDLILSTANFHTPEIALTFDTLAIVITQLATASAYRTIKLMNAQLSGLPKYLSPLGGASNGYNSMQKTVSALQGEIRLKATPASLDAVPVSETVEDHAPQTLLTIRKLDEQLMPLRLLFAIEALVAAQAVDLRGKPRLSEPTRLIYDAIRAEVPMLEDDRENGPDADRVAAILADGALMRRLRDSLGDDALFGLS
ncbi:HAL/PAL/TAL family ammonia-lyase [Paracoccus aminophilus]|uniref:Histidine ammonia-lyase n=1 Tax=Paracoccus aminophilus JCM 7686 TaxID=1367847 RepID=S5XUM9_PARAH|nr:aromatic amino acid ammonia-lyase [Paracoccus aminophilus]AGT08922.1 histidine ammonia-lyase [Paracoccus aminophilus JCM 7686]